MRIWNSLKRSLGFGRSRSPKLYGVPFIDALQQARAGETTALPPVEEGRDFVDFAASYAPQSKAQLFQDLWAFWEAGGRTDGYFVEVGANDGIVHSNSYFLENLGWNGIVAEPNPELSQELRRNRKCYICTDAVHSESGKLLDFTIAGASVLSRLTSINPNDLHERSRAKKARSAKVRTISLSDLLVQAKAPPVIDFLSLDTEGSEYEILSTFDFTRWTIKSICVEHNHTPARASLDRLLSSRGYIRRWPGMDIFDDWYVRAPD